MFEARLMVKTIGQDLGLLQAIDDRLAMYGWLTNTGIKFVIVVDMQGRAIEKDGKNHLMGLRSTDVPPVCIAILVQCVADNSRLSGRCRLPMSISCVTHSMTRTSRALRMGV